jgi:hypothetical protein
MAELSRLRLVTGIAILIIGFCSPLLIPIVASSGLSVVMKTTLSGLLALGIPELFMIIAVSVLGRDGYAFLKKRVLVFIEKISPEHVSHTRYRIGMILFVTPLFAGWIIPYLGYYFEAFPNALWLYIGFDIMFFISFFVLGGDFWDRFRGLFSYKH